MEKNNIKLEKFNKIMMKVLLVLCILIVVVVGMIIYQKYQYKQLTKRENLTLDEFVAITIVEELGKTNDKKERFVGSDELDGYKRVFLNMDGHYDNTYQVEKSVSQTMNVLSKLVKDREFYDADFKGISFQWMITVMDKYGNESEEVGCIITLDKHELYKIKWDNVSREGFVDITKTFWVHDALLK